MDKSTAAHAEKEKRSIGARLRSAFDIRMKKREEPIYDLVMLAIAFLLSRTHVVFGAHPLGIALVSLLPDRVWIATLGAVLGGLTLGKSGIVYAMISVIVVFLRVIISGTSDGEKKTFSEGLLLRMSAALIGGFVAAVYEVLLSGFSLTTVAFGVSMILLPPVAVFGASGVLDGPSVRELLLGDARVLSLTGKREGERYNLIFYQVSALISLFVVSFSLREYSFLGISPAYVVAALATLVTARRLGAMRALAVGFAMALPLSSAYSAAFALVGIAAGMLFKLGLVYALVGGGVVLAAFSAYAGGLVGLLSTLPEYMIAALVAAPIVKHLSPEKTEEEGASAEREINDMIGTVALSYKSKYSGALDALGVSLSALSSVVARHTDLPDPPRVSEVRSLVYEVATRYLTERDPYASVDKPELPDVLCERITERVMKNERIGTEEFVDYPSLAPYAEGIADTVNRAASILRAENFKLRRESGYAEYLELLAKLISEARVADEREKSPNDELSVSIPAALEVAGLTLGSGKAFGQRIPHFIIAAEDESGKRITSPELKNELERLSSRKLGTPEFYRRGRMALMEVSARKTYAASAAFTGKARDGETVSGDTVRLYETDGGVFCAVISDGVGSGSDAERASRFVTDFISSAPLGHTALRLANHIIRKRGEEFAATVDALTFDLYTGEGYFLKCGACASYVKRGTSIFRIKSRTSPLGVLKSAECEKIKVELEDGDIVVMTSDGAVSADDTPWIYEFLAKEPVVSLSEYAELILKEASRHTAATDDMTVAVVKITRK